jgi:hypothetical protein
MKRLDLLAPRRLSRLLGHPLWPFAVALLPALVLGAMAVYGLFYHGIPFVDAEGPLRDTNIVSLSFWVLWLMGVIVTAPLLGRLWCGVCPVGWLSDGVRRIGLGRPVPTLLATFLPMILLLLLVRVAVYLWGVNHFPDATAVMILLFVAGALAVGLIFRGRAFCRWWCPIGGTLGILSRVSPFGIGVRDAEVCRRCPGRDCIAGRDEAMVLTLPETKRPFTRRLRGCPVSLHPADAARAKECVVCLQCHRNCPYGNVTLGWSSPRHRAGLPLDGPYEVLFLLVLAGSIIDILLRVWPSAEELIFALPLALGRALAWSADTMAVAGTVWSVGLFPLLAIGVPLVAGAYLAGLSITPAAEEADADLATPEPRGRFRRAGMLAASFIPLVAAANVSLALVKLNARVVYLKTGISDPAGIATYLAMQVQRTMPVPGSLVPLPILRWLVLLVALGGAVGSWILLVATLRRAGTPQGRWVGGVVLALPMALLTVIVLGGVFSWLFP